MASERPVTRQSSPPARRPAAAPPSPARAVPPASPARTLQQRMGSEGATALLARVAQPAAPALPATNAGSATPHVQTAMRVSAPSDPSEKEADATAKRVMRMPAPPARAASGKTTARGPDAREVTERSAALSRQAERAGQATPEVTAEIMGEMGSGDALPGSIRTFMEPRFRADFGAVRIHTDGKAAGLAARLSARAFAFGRHIFFGRGEYRPESRDGMELIAHELTHTIQQRAVVQRSTADVQVSQSSPAQVQRFGISDALDYFADRVDAIPGFRMFTIIIGMNPVNRSPVERSAANILRAVVEFMPGGVLITQALDNHGVFDRAGAWIEQQISGLGISGGLIVNAIATFLDSLSWRDIFRLGDVWERAKRIFLEPIQRIRSFVSGLINGILELIREVILRPLANLASGTRGWDLLTAVLGRNPITGEPVPRTAATMIGGFMRLIGQEEVWANIQRGNAVARAWAWFQGALAGALGFVQQIPALFISTLRSLTIADLVQLPQTFARVAGVFGTFIGNFFSWAGGQVMSLLQIIFEVVAPGVMPYIRRAAGAFTTIVRNPIGFIGNLVRAGIAGFRQFAGNFLTHLRGSLVAWLTGTLSGAGVYIPQSFSLMEIVKFVLSVLGVTWQNIRTKLVRAIGETAVRALETGFQLVTTLVRDGPAAAWQQIVEGISNLRAMVMEQIMAFVRARIVQAAITRLVTSLNPVGAFIQAIIAIYNTIMFLVERLRQIAQVAAAFIDSISAIAGGAIAAAANRVETTMAGLLTLVISFLARLVGLGRVSDAVVEIINRIRAPIDRALDRVVNWIVAQARRLGRLVAQAGLPQDPNQRLNLGLQAATAAVNRLPGSRIGQAVITPVLGAIRVRYGFQSLEPFVQGGRWKLRGRINPEGVTETAKTESTTGASVDSATDEWPVGVGSNIRIPNSPRIHKVLELRINEIVYSVTVVRRGGIEVVSGGRITTPRALFMSRWQARQIYLASGASAQERRQEIIDRYGSTEGPIFADAIMRRGDLAGNLGILDPAQAHHIIPVELIQDLPRIRQLLLANWNYHAPVNGVPLAKGFHGNHPQYNMYVLNEIQSWERRNSSRPVSDFKTWVEETLIMRLRDMIADAQRRNAATGETLNDYFRAVIAGERGNP